MRAWTFQDHRQKQKLGNDKCPWSVGWIDPDGKRKSKRVGSKSNAEKFRRKIEGQLASGTYEQQTRTQWSQFRTDYQKQVLTRTSASNQLSAKISLDHFQRICKPGLVRSIKTQTIDKFVAQRLTEEGARGGLVAPATVNRELRYIKAALRKAYKWKHLPEVPEITMLREPEKLPSYVTPEHFDAIYMACSVATLPEGLPYSASDWWQALLVFSYMTGWRISEPLALKRADLDLIAATAITRERDNKGRRGEIIPLHPVVVDHLRAIDATDVLVFPWTRGRRELWPEFHRIQKAAGIHLPCQKADEHQCTEACHFYGFHDLRRAFATVNAESMTADALQRLMRHKHYSTTQRYINMASQLNRAVENLHVPDVLRRDTTQDEVGN